jgi:EmrB/QacA subfamily drug resistance transporter
MSDHALEPAAPEVLAADEAPPALSPGRRTMVLAAMCLALVLVVAGVSMLVNALSLIAEDLDLSQSKQSWVVDAYALPFAALLLIAGAIGDRFGRRGALLAGTTLFGAGSLLSMMADTGNQLLTFRAITGVGAALIMPGTLSTITSVFPPEARARAVGIWSGFAMGGGTLGMVGSGLMLNYWSWRSVFVVATVLAAVAFVAIALAVPTTRSSEPVGLDPGGTALSALAVGSIVFGIIEGPERGWTTPLTMGSLLIGALAVVGFVLWELRADQPLLDPRLFRLRGFGTGAAGLFVMFLAVFGFMLVAIQYLQLILGYSPLKSALGLLPQMALMIPLSAVAAQLSMRFGQKRLTAIGLLVSAAGMVWFVRLSASSGYWDFFVGMLLVTVGIGLAMTPATTAIVSSLPLAKQGVASAVNDTAREVGAALGVAVLGSAFNTAYRGDITDHLSGLPASTAAGAREAPAIALDSARALGSRGTDLLDAAQNAFVSGFRAAVLIAGVLLVGAALYTWWRGPSAEPAPASGEDLAAAAAEGDLAIEPSVTAAR